jgi:hypothetical protein
VLKELYLYQREYQKVSGQKQSLSVNGGGQVLGVSTKSLGSTFSSSYDDCSHGVSSVSTVPTKPNSTEIKGIELGLLSKSNLEKILLGAGAAIFVAGAIALIPEEAIAAVGYAAYLAALRLLPTIYSLGNAITETPEGGVVRLEIQAGKQGVLRSVGSGAKSVTKIGGYELSSHAEARMIERGISVEQIANTIKNGSEFNYFHEGVWKIGYYNTKDGIFVGVKDVITTVIDNVSSNYIENLKKLTP